MITAIIIIIVYLIGVVIFSIFEYKQYRELTGFAILSWFGLILMGFMAILGAIENKLNNRNK